MAPRKNWTIATARQHLPALIRSAAREPQRVYRRDKLVAAVVGPALAEEVAAPRVPPLADALVELQRICSDEDYELAQGVRGNRANPLARRVR